MVDFINILLEGLGLPTVIPFGELDGILLDLSDWWQFFGSPTLLFSSFFYLACSFGIFHLTLGLLYRLVKRAIHYPKRKACEYD